MVLALLIQYTVVFFIRIQGKDLEHALLQHKGQPILESFHPFESGSHVDTKNACGLLAVKSNDLQIFFRTGCGQVSAAVSSETFHPSYCLPVVRNPRVDLLEVSGSEKYHGALVAAYCQKSQMVILLRLISFKGFLLLEGVLVDFGVELGWYKWQELDDCGHLAELMHFDIFGSLDTVGFLDTP